MKQEIPLEQAYRLLAGGPVTMVTARVKDKVNIMPAAWAMPISVKPPLVALAVNLSHFTCELIKRSQQFVLNIPSAELAKQVKYCGSVSGREVDKFPQSGLHTAEPHCVDVPLIEECLAHIECGVIEAYELGDHMLFVGEVVAASAQKEAFQETWKLENKETKPLNHLGGDRYATLGEPFEPEA